ncbi:hypothetical protein, partial [Geotalea toluenoxydans]|uniref:hypothetical protein n=1 Tax=Geotalea toluenoxydans TaxID=421624 RepID=UPI0006D14359
PTAVSPATGTTVASLTPTLTITNAMDPDSDTLSYDFEVYAGATLIAAQYGGPSDPSGSTSWTPTQPLADNTVYQWRARAFDGDRYGEWMSMATFTTHLPITSITAEIRFEPETLNQKSQGNWVTVEIELPDGYKAGEIDIASIRLEGTVSAESKPYQIRKGKCNDSLMVKFSRSQVIAILPEGSQVPVHVTGRVGAVQFEGIDVIRVIKTE